MQLSSRFAGEEAGLEAKAACTEAHGHLVAKGRWWPDVRC